VQKFWALLFGAVILAEAGLFLVAPFVPGWWLPQNLCSFGPHVDGLFYVILAVTGFFFLLTEGIMVYAMWKYVAQPGQKSTYTHGSHKLELVWTIVPAVILLFIAFAQVKAWSDIKYQSRMPTPDQVFEVTARQFEWRFRYPTAAQNTEMLKEWGKNEKGQPEPGRESALAAEWQREPHADDVHLVNEVHTWKGAKVRFYLKSRDVIHSFFLPNMRIKQDALPGKVIPVWFDTAGETARSNCHHDAKTETWVMDTILIDAVEQIDKSKQAELACAELCGWGHYKMRGIVYIHESEPDYKLWLEDAFKEERRTKERRTAP
jgi:cytochrome c oxidase subunit 2